MEEKRDVIFPSTDFQTECYLHCLYVPTSGVLFQCFQQTYSQSWKRMGSRLRWRQSDRFYSPCWNLLNESVCLCDMWLPRFLCYHFILKQNTFKVRCSGSFLKLLLIDWLIDCNVLHFFFICCLNFPYFVRLNAQDSITLKTTLKMSQLNNSQHCSAESEQGPRPLFVKVKAEA